MLLRIYVILGKISHRFLNGYSLSLYIYIVNFVNASINKILQL